MAPEPLAAKLCRMQVGFQVREHVGRRRAQRARPGEGIHIPGACRPVVERMALDEARLLAGRQRHGGVGQLQWHGDFFADQLRITGAGVIGERLAEESHPQIAVEKWRVSGLSHAVPGEELVQVQRPIVAVGIVRVRGSHIVGQPRQPRVLGHQIKERDLSSLRPGNRSGRQELADRLIEHHLALRHHLCEHQSGEGLGDGPDFENGVRCSTSPGKHARHAVAYHADGDPG